MLATFYEQPLQLLCTYKQNCSYDFLNILNAFAVDNSLLFTSLYLGKLSSVC